MKRIISAQALPEFHLEIRFDDGVEGIVELSAEAGNGIFAAWKDPKHFASVKIDRHGRALVWPGEIDLCADALYLEITGLNTEALFPTFTSETSHA